MWSGGAPSDSMFWSVVFSLNINQAFSFAVDKMLDHLRLGESFIMKEARRVYEKKIEPKHRLMFREGTKSAHHVGFVVHIQLLVRGCSSDDRGRYCVDVGRHLGNRRSEGGRRKIYQSILHGKGTGFCVFLVSADTKFDFAI